MKNLYSQIYDNCGSKSISICCAIDNLILCQDCDWDAHGSCAVSGVHDRNPFEGFSGCPSASDLASSWGFDIEAKKPPSLQEQVGEEHVDELDEDIIESDIELDNLTMILHNRLEILQVK